MPLLRAPENRRTGIEINPNVRYPDQTEAAIAFSQVETRRASSLFVIGDAASRVSTETSDARIPAGVQKCSLNGAVVIARLRGESKGQALHGAVRGRQT